MICRPFRPEFRNRRAFLTAPWRHRGYQYAELQSSSLRLVLGLSALRIVATSFSIGAVLCWVLSPQVLRGQPQANIPVPEYFGIYAVSDDRLIKLDGKEVRVDKNLPVRMGQRQAVSSILNGAPVASSQVSNLPLFSPDLKIIVYLQGSGTISPLQVAGSLKIEPLVFVRNVSVDTGFPNNVRRSGPENGWEYGNAPELLGLASGGHPEALELLKKPFPGRKDMIVAGFAEQLAAGVYRFTLRPGDPLLGGGTYFTFAVEPLAEAESSKCVDASITYAMMVSNAEYLPCHPPGPANGGHKPNNPDSPGYHNNRGLELAKEKRFDEAQAEFATAARLDPPNAAKYLYNFGAILLTAGQTEASEQAFKKAIEADPEYPDAQFQYAVALSAKLTAGKDGKVIAPPGMKEALQKYLRLQPKGPYSEAAKGMLRMIGPR
jgi:tetratricopeptide (TPR) repeat protein